MQLTQKEKEKKHERISGGNKKCVGVAYSSINRRKDPHIKSNFTLLLCSLDIAITNLFKFYCEFLW